MGQPTHTTRGYDWASGQKVDYTGTAGTSSSLAEGEYCLSPTTDCLVELGGTAAASAGSLFVPAGAMFHFYVPAAATLSVVQVSASGSLYILPVK